MSKSKIFVIIMFVTSLTLVNVNSSGELSPTSLSRRLRGLSVNARPSDVPSHSSTPRRNRISSGNVNPSGLSPLFAQNSSRQSRQPQHGSSSADVNFLIDQSTSSHRFSYGSISLYNQQREANYQIVYNTYNPFSYGDFEHRCYSQIRVFCDTDKNDVESNHCIRRAILFFKNNFLIKGDTGGYENFLIAVRSFFEDFPINAENIPLPLSFCFEKATAAIESSANYQALSRNQEAMNAWLGQYVNGCLEVLYEYHAYVPQDLSRSDDEMATDLLIARYNIAHLALNYKTTLGMQGENLNIEYSYIIEIAQNVTSNDDHHNPLVYCHMMGTHFGNLPQNEW